MLQHGLHLYHGFVRTSPHVFQGGVCTGRIIFPASLCRCRTDSDCKNLLLDGIVQIARKPIAFLLYRHLSNLMFPALVQTRR